MAHFHKGTRFDVLNLNKLTRDREITVLMKYQPEQGDDRAKLTFYEGNHSEKIQELIEDYSFSELKSKRLGELWVAALENNTKEAREIGLYVSFLKMQDTELKDYIFTSLMYVHQQGSPFKNRLGVGSGKDLLEIAKKYGLNVYSNENVELNPKVIFEKTKLSQMLEVAYY